MKDLRLAHLNLDFEVVPVAYEAYEHQLDWALPRKNWEQWPFQSVIQDSILGYNFPHNSIPHMVWIYKGKVIAKPKWDYATIENVQAVLDGNQPKLVNVYQDEAIDPEREFFVKGNGDSEVVYERTDAKISRYTPEYQEELTKFVYQNGKTIMYAVNVPLTHIYYEAFKDSIHPFLDWREGSGLFWTVSGSFRKMFLSDRVKPSIEGDMEVDLAHETWNMENLYSFAIKKDGKVPEGDMRKLFQKHVIICFQNLLGIYAEIYPSKILEYVTLRTDDPALTMERLGKPTGKVYKGKQKDGTFRYSSYQGMTMQVKRYLADLKDRSFPYGMLIDSTGIPADYKCDFRLPAYKKRTYSEFQDFLKQYGMRTTIEYKKVPVLLIQQVSKDYQP